MAAIRGVSISHGCLPVWLDRLLLFVNPPSTVVSSGASSHSRYRLVTSYHKTFNLGSLADEEAERRRGSLTAGLATQRARLSPPFSKQMCYVTTSGGREHPRSRYLEWMSEVTITGHPSLPVFFPWPGECISSYSRYDGIVC